MAKNQKSYTPEFKQQIVDLYNAGGTSYPQLEREYGVNRSTLSNWVKQLSPIKVSEEYLRTRIGFFVKSILFCIGTFLPWFIFAISQYTPVQNQINIF